MSEKQKRQYLAGEALLLGYGGISLINRITGVSINVIRRGIEELQQGDVYVCDGSDRTKGAGRPKFTDREMGWNFLDTAGSVTKKWSRSENLRQTGMSSLNT